MEDVHSEAHLGRHVGERKQSSKVLPPPGRMLGQNKQAKNPGEMKKKFILFKFKKNSLQNHRQGSKWRSGGGPNSGDRAQKNFQQKRSVVDQAGSKIP